MDLHSAKRIPVFEETDRPFPHMVINGIQLYSYLKKQEYPRPENRNHYRIPHITIEDMIGTYLGIHSTDWYQTGALFSFLASYRNLNSIEAPYDFDMDDDSHDILLAVVNNRVMGFMVYELYTHNQGQIEYIIKRIGDGENKTDNPFLSAISRAMIQYLQITRPDAYIDATLDLDIEDVDAQSFYDEMGFSIETYLDTKYLIYRPKSNIT